MNDALLGFALALSCGVRVAVAEDHLPKSWPRVIRHCVTWADVVLVALPVAIVVGSRPGLQSLLLFIIVALAALSVKHVLDRPKPFTPTVQTPVHRTKREPAQKSGDDGSCKVLPFRREDQGSG